MAGGHGPKHGGKKHQETWPHEHDPAPLSRGELLRAYNGGRRTFSNGGGTVRGVVGFRPRVFTKRNLTPPKQGMRARSCSKERKV